MIRPFLTISAVTLMSACSSPPDEPMGSTSEQALRVGWRDIPDAFWERSVDCDGAHFDRLRTSDPNNVYVDKIEWQLVITDGGAVDYLNRKVDEQKRSPIGLSVIDASNAPHGANEIVIYIGQIYGAGWREGARQTSFGAKAGFGGNEAWIGVDRYEWFVDQGGGLYGKANDLKISYHRNGWSDGCTNYEEATGICRGYASGGLEPKPGWGEFEIANFTFRGCRNR
jgi:hypothetical protein